MSEELKLSVSKVKSFDLCRKQYSYNYILHLPKKDQDYHIFGKFLHKVLEWFHQQYIDGCYLPYNITLGNAFKTVWAEYKNKMTPEMKKECWDILNQYLQIVSKNKNNGMPFNIISVEKEFNFPIGENLLIRGAIDIVKLDDDNVLHVADWKSTKNKKYLVNDDFLQLKTYAFILMSQNPEITKIRTSYVLMRHNFEYVTREFSVDDIMPIKQKYEEYSEQIKSEKEFAASPSQLCGWCSFLEHCVEGKAKVNENSMQSHKVYGEVSW
jgi:ATP-dependent helicase/DNAse subunit B